MVTGECLLDEGLHARRLAHELHEAQRRAHVQGGRAGRLVRVRVRGRGRGRARVKVSVRVTVRVRVRVRVRDRVRVRVRVS